MQEIAGMTKSINEEFKTESEEIVRDVQGQLDAFGGFKNQERGYLRFRRGSQSEGTRLERWGGGSTSFVNELKVGRKLSSNGRREHGDASGPYG
jgi:hypothetical protein